MNSKITFKPRPSNGWIWVAVIGAVLTAICLGLIFTLGFSSAFAITIFLSGVIGVGFLFIAACIPTMRYEIGNDKLIITYGPILRYAVNLADIKSIRRSDLNASLISSFRFPGLALFGVPYTEIGTVRMCATSASDRILVIETESKKYGVTPADESAFVAELRKRMEK